MLVVCPASVLANWMRELGTWGAFRAAVYHGEGERRAAALQRVRQRRAEVLITSGATYRCACTAPGVGATKGVQMLPASYLVMQCSSSETLSVLLARMIAYPSLWQIPAAAGLHVTLPAGRRLWTALHWLPGVAACARHACAPRSPLSCSAAPACARLNQDELLGVDWHVVIWDEAHVLKNRHSLTYEAAQRFRTPRLYGLTGTAMAVRCPCAHACMPCMLGTSWADVHGRLPRLHKGQVSRVPTQASTPARSGPLAMLQGFDACQLDEGHLMAPRGARCLAGDGSPSPARLLRAQNKHLELFNLLLWANPHLMGDWEGFHEYYVKPLKLGQKRDASDYLLAQVRSFLIQSALCPPRAAANWSPHREQRSTQVPGTRHHHASSVKFACWAFSVEHSYMPLHMACSCTQVF